MNKITKSTIAVAVALMATSAFANCGNDKNVGNGCSGVSSINNKIGDVTITGSNGISVSTSGSTVTVSGAGLATTSALQTTNNTVTALQTTVTQNATTAKNYTDTTAQSMLASAKSYTDTAVGSVQTQLNGVSATANAALTTGQNASAAVTTETTRATTAETALGGRIDGVSKTVGDLQTQVNNQATSTQALVNNLQGSIDTNADVAKQQAANAQANAIAASKATLTGSTATTGGTGSATVTLNQGGQKSTATITGLVSSSDVNAAVGTETDRAKAAEAGLQKGVNNAQAAANNAQGTANVALGVGLAAGALAGKAEVDAQHAQTTATSALTQSQTNANNISTLQGQVGANTSAITDLQTNSATHAEVAADAALAYGAAVTTSAQYTNTQVAQGVKSAVGQAKTYTDQQVGAVQAQVTVNTQNIATNAQAISTETTRATTAEAGLQTQVTANKTAIATETTRATTAETKLQGNIDSESTRAQTAEQANATAIGNETQRATTAEQGLQTQMNKTAVAMFDQSTAYTDQQVAAGVKSANQYTDQQFNKAEADINGVRSDMYGGVASALAVAGLPQPYQNGKSMMSAAASTYHGATGYAIGLSTAQGNWVVKGAVTGNSRGDFGATIGAGYQF